MHSWTCRYAAPQQQHTWPLHQLCEVLLTACTMYTVIYLKSNILHPHVLYVIAKYNAPNNNNPESGRRLSSISSPPYNPPYMHTRETLLLHNNTFELVSAKARVQCLFLHKNSALCYVGELDNRQEVITISVMRRPIALLETYIYVRASCVHIVW